MIQATFTTGVPSATVHGLHQWDRGRKLQIISEGLPAAFEVHFECPGMKEAEVRVTELVDGVPTVRIPDRCLKQPAPIKAWVYVTDDTSGRTELSVTLVVTPRLTPPDTSTPEQEDEAADKYDQLFTLMNEAYDAIEACKNVDANADEAQAAADNASASAKSASSSAIAASTHATRAETHSLTAKTHADTARDYQKACHALIQDISARAFVSYSTSYVESVSQKGALIYCEGDQGQYYHAVLEDASGFFYDFGLIFWDGLHSMRSAGPFCGYNQMMFLEIWPETSSNDDYDGTTYHAGRATVYVVNVITGDNLVFAGQTLVITPLTGATHSPE